MENNMKRFLSFYGDIYYPSGGMEDFVGDFATLDEAKEGIEKKLVGEGGLRDNWEYQWAHIYDTDTRDIVWSEKEEWRLPTL
jgi:hypothetical protein